MPYYAVHTPPLSAAMKQICCCIGKELFSPSAERLLWRLHEVLYLMLCQFKDSEFMRQDASSTDVCVCFLMLFFNSALQGAHGLKGNEGPQGPPGPAVSIIHCIYMLTFHWFRCISEDSLHAKVAT